MGGGRVPNARGDGVFFEDLGKGKWKIRWRERVAGLPRPKNRSTTIVGTVLDRDRIVMEVRDALATSGTYEPERSAVLEAPAPVPPCTVADVLLGCIAARVAAGKYRGKTQNTYTSYATRVIESIHRINRVPEDQPLSVTVLCRDLFVQLHELDTKRSASEMMKYAPLRLLVDAWGWAHDENVEARENDRPDPWPGLPSAPRRTKDYLPRVPKYGRTIAPTMAHIDSCLRHFPGKVNQGTKVAAILMRYTGLRSDQVFSIRSEDLNVADKTLYVRAGKTEQEKADARTVPLADALFREPGVLGWIEIAQDGEPLFPKRRHAWTIDREDASRTKKPTVTFRSAWEAATAADEVPEHVWAPPNRKIARPEHSFRAAFQAFLTGERIDSDVVDFLVGHEGGDVREVHYGREVMEAARTAVNLIPAINWNAPARALPENVHELRPRT